MKTFLITRPLLILALMALLGLLAQDANAAFTGAFDELMSEFHDRATVLGGSPDKGEQKQFKTINKVIKTINKPADSLADDLKTAATVSKTLQKAFPGEFATSAAAGAVGTLPGLLTGVFDSLRSEIDDLLTELIAEADDLPEGPAKSKAQSAITQAQGGLPEVVTAESLASLPKDLATALKAVGAGFKAVTSKSGGGSGGGGGGGSSGQFMKADIDGAKFSASKFGAINSPHFAIQGERSVNLGKPNYDVQFIQLEAFFFSGTGIYTFSRTSNSDGGALYLHSSKTVGDENWRTDLDSPGGGTMTVDSYNSTNGEVRGSFDLTVVNHEDGRVLQITGTFFFRDDALKGF